MAATLAGAHTLPGATTLPHQTNVILPAIKQSHSKVKDKRKKSVRLASNSQLNVTIAADEISYDEDLFKHHCLVDSPRRIILEKTTLGMETVLSAHLETFFNKTVDISNELFLNAQSDVTELMEYLKPRMKTLGRKYGFKFNKYVTIGSVFDETEVIHLTDVDVLLEIEKDKTTYHNHSEGYKYIGLKKYKQIEGGKPDSFRFGRSKDGRYLSSLIVAKHVHELVERSLKLHPTAHLEELDADGTDYGQVTVTLNEQYRINIIPAIYQEADDIYLVTRCYAFDENPLSDCSWRICHANKERAIINSMNKADRGVRCKAYKLLKALIQVEPTLQGIPSYHIKTVLLHTFDDTVDNMPRWQRTSVESCFQRLLTDLVQFYRKRCLPNFFIHRQNLFEFMPVRLLARYQSRLSFLASNQRELLRVLRKRSVNS